jgi:hypothetical protein
MEVAIRKTKRASAGPATGLPTHSNLSSSANGLGASYTGLSSSSTRKSFGSSQQRLSTLSMYNDAPQEEITLDQFERSGVDRLQGQSSTLTKQTTM